MKSKTQLSVRPVRKSKKPDYPSWHEPNPLEQPYAQPYPFTQKAINWLAASGLCGALFLMPEAEGMAKQVDRVEAVEGDTLGNPFPLRIMSPLHRSVGYGTGAPRYLNEEDVKSVFEMILKENGFNLRAATVKAGDGTVKLDGYDDDAKIGYLWLGRERLDESFAIKNGAIKYDKSKWLVKLNTLRVAEKRLNEFDKSIAKINDFLIYHRFKDKAVKNLMAKIKALMDAGAPDWQEDYKYLIYEYLIDEKLVWYFDNHRGSEKFKEYLHSVLGIEPGPEKQIILDKTMNIIPVMLVDEDWAADAVIAASDSQEFEINLERLYYLQNVYSYLNKSFPERADKIKALIIEAKDNWKIAIPIAQQWMEEAMITLNEANSLENDTKKGTRCIAFIYPSQDRFGYYTTEADIQARKNLVWRRFKEQNPGADSTRYEEVTKYENSSRTKETAIQNLEKQVLDYILWAKQQRGY